MVCQESISDHRISCMLVKQQFVDKVRVHAVAACMQQQYVALQINIVKTKEQRLEIYVFNTALQQKDHKHRNSNNTAYCPSNHDQHTIWQDVREYTSWKELF